MPPASFFSPQASAPPNAHVPGRLAAMQTLPRRLAPAWSQLTLAAAALAALALTLVIAWPGSVAAILALAATTTLGSLALIAALAARGQRRIETRAEARILDGVAEDPEPVLLTDLSGVPLGANPAARERTGEAIPVPAALLARWSAEPARAIAALMAEASTRGRSHRDFIRPDGACRLSVHRAGKDPRSWLARRHILVWRQSAMGASSVRGLDALGLPVLTLGPEGRPIARNAAFRQLSGETGTDASPPLDPVLSAALTPLLQGANPVSLSVPGPGGGQTRLAFLTSARDGQQDILFLPPWLHNAGETAHRSLHQDFEDVPVALALIAGDGRILDSNRLARSLLGLAPGELRYFWEVVEGLGRPVADWLVDARQGRALNRPEVLRAVMTGPETFVQVTLRQAPAQGAEAALIAVISDATELKSLEARFVQSQKMQAIGQLAGGVAHDFNNLLTAIGGHCDLLLLNRDAYDADHGDLVQIRQNTNRAAALVRQLLAFSRKQTLTPEILAPESLLEDLAHLLTRLVGERITLWLRHDPDIGAIRADRRQLEQVIMNLVVNARDAMPMGGEIRITTEALRLEQEREFGRTRLPAGNYAVIRVADDGVGVPADLADKIFEPFFTTKRPGEGTGLGLSTAYGIVKQMGGWIFIDSIEGSGTVFTLYFASLGPSADVLAIDAGARSVRQERERVIAAAADEGTPGRPATAPDATASEPPPAPAAAPRDGAVVLLVEDEAPVRAFAARALRMHGYQVIEAENGEQALEFLADPALRVDIFVSDVIMPGLDGPGWVAQALAARPDTPVVFVSGYTEDAVGAALTRTPRAVFLGKPFALNDFCRAIADQLAIRG